MQTEVGLVRDAQRIIEIVVDLHGDDRAEDLLGAHIHRGLCTHDHGGHEHSVRVELTATRHRSAIGHGLGDPARNAISLGLRDQRGDIGGVVHRVTDDESAHAGDELLDECIGDRTVHENALSGDARLTRVREPGNLDLGRGGLPVAIGFDHDGCVITELQAHPLARGTCANSPSHLRGTGESNECDTGVIDKCIAHGSAAAGDHLQVTVRETGFFEKLRQQDRRERCLRGGLEHDRAASRDSRAQLVRDEVEREVEGSDCADHAHRNSHDEADLADTNR